MKKPIILSLAAAVITLILVSTGCKKTGNPSESWIWKGNTYTSTSCNVSSDSDALYGRNTSLTVQNGSNTLNVIFFGSLPTQSCIDTVAAWGATGDVNMITISLASGGATYQSTGGNGTNQIVNVTVKNNQVTVSTPSGNPAELLNIASGSVDSSGVSFTVVQ